VTASAKLAFTAGTAAGDAERGHVPRSRPRSRHLPATGKRRQAATRQAATRQAACCCYPN